MDVLAHLFMSPLCPRTATWKHQVIVFDGRSRSACSSAKSHTTVRWPRHASFIPLPSPRATIGRMVIPVHTCDTPAAPSCGMGTPVHISSKAQQAPHGGVYPHHLPHLSHPIIDTWWYTQDCLHTICVHAMPHGGAGTTVYVLAMFHGHHVAVGTC